MKTLDDYKKEFTDKWVKDQFNMDEEYYSLCVDDEKVWKFIEEMIVEILLYAEPDNMRDDDGQDYIIGYLEARVNFMNKVGLIVPNYIRRKKDDLSKLLNN